MQYNGTWKKVAFKKISMAYISKKDIVANKFNKIFNLW